MSPYVLLTSFQLRGKGNRERYQRIITKFRSMRWGVAWSRNLAFGAKIRIRTSSLHSFQTKQFTKVSRKRKIWLFCSLETLLTAFDCVEGYWLSSNCDIKTTHLQNHPRVSSQSLLVNSLVFRSNVLLNTPLSHNENADEALFWRQKMVTKSYMKILR